MISPPWHLGKSVPGDNAGNRKDWPVLGVYTDDVA